jgi:hypothetical protein
MILLLFLLPLLLLTKFAIHRSLCSSRLSFSLSFPFPIPCLLIANQKKKSGSPLGFCLVRMKKKDLPKKGVRYTRMCGLVGIGEQIGECSDIYTCGNNGLSSYPVQRRSSAFPVYYSSNRETPTFFDSSGHRVR